MGDSSTENLIDFNVEEETNEKYSKKQTSDNVAVCFIPPPSLSLENNPFDLVQKLTVFRPDDPFDIVEKEATLKARQNCSKSVEVKLGNLLSLSEDSETIAVTATDSNAFYTAEEPDLENESPPITLSSKWSPCSSTASCESSDSNKEHACVAKARKTRNHRNRLLKLSISNAVFSTPNSSRAALNSESNLKNDLSEKLISLSGGNEESSIDSESPVKSIDEDLKLENTETQNYTEKDYDHDLEMMEIPMLRQLPSPEKVNNTNQLQEYERVPEKSRTDTTKKQVNVKLNQLSDLESLRRKLRAKRLETNNHKDISELITDFKNLISESKMIDEHKKHEIDDLLKTLTSTLSAVHSSPETAEDSRPQPIARQSAFDIELQDKDQVTEKHTTELVGQPANIEDVPDTMVKSSATYDGETAEDKAYLNLPQIDPPSPEHKQSLDANVHGIIEQLQHFLEHQHLSSENSDVSHTSSGSTIMSSNPTFIVVMPTVAQSQIGEETHDETSSFRRRSQSLSLHDKLKIVQWPIMPVPEIQVSENYSSPPLNTSSSYLTPLSSEFKTPARFLERRNSFSSVTPLTPTRFSRYNQSVMGNNRLSSAHSPIRSSKLTMRAETQQPVLVQRSSLAIKPDPKKKVKTTNSLLRSNAPLKATLPLKHLVPTAKTAPSSTASMRTSTSNTSMHLLAKGGQISHTSTPMPAPRNNVSKPFNKVSPNMSTASKITGKSTDNCVRYSNNTLTPVGKTLTMTSASSTTYLQRRSISEFKVKSPNKARTSFTNLKSNLSRPLSNTSKTTIRPTVGSSFGHLTAKNKENKQPQN